MIRRRKDRKVRTWWWDEYQGGYMSTDIPADEFPPPPASMMAPRIATDEKPEDDKADRPG